MAHRKYIRYSFLFFTAWIVIIQIVALSPTHLEENRPLPTTMSIESLIEDDEPSLIKDLPKKQLSEYKIQKFQYVSVQNGEKNWRILAKKAYLYQTQKLVHARDIVAYLYNPDGAITTISGHEAKYLMNEKDLEVYGKVHTVFPDGFQIDSDYLRYSPEFKQIEIPLQYSVIGRGVLENNEKFQFKSNGLNYKMNEAMIYLLSQVNVSVIKNKSKPEYAEGVPEKTEIFSDSCSIDRAKNLAYFRMNSDRPSELKFVQIYQPDLYTKARRADLRYGDFSKMIEYMTAYDDVFIKEKNNDSNLQRYATSGKAKFDAKSDLITLTHFPQVYQGEDTVTGDIILMHRDSDIVEVQNSNSFSFGQSQ